MGQTCGSSSEGFNLPIKTQRFPHYTEMERKGARGRGPVEYCLYIHVHICGVLVVQSRMTMDMYMYRHISSFRNEKRRKKGGREGREGEKEGGNGGRESEGRGKGRGEGSH